MPQINKETILLKRNNLIRDMILFKLKSAYYAVGGKKKFNKKKKK